MYLMVHALNWLELTTESPLRETKEWELWPGRCEACHRYEFGLKEKYERLMSMPDESAGVFCLPNDPKNMQGPDAPLIELARTTYGARLVVCRLDHDLEENRRTLGAEFSRGLDEDRRRAEATRGGDLTEGEIAAWERSKAWATDLRMQLEERGYSFDPANVEFTAFGEDFCGCAGTFPIHIGRALRLSRPIVRRFDLMNPDCSPVLMESTLVEQNLEMPEHVRLFIFKTDEGRYIAQYWEGMHGLYDRPRRVTVNFPPESVRLKELSGRSSDETYGQTQLGVGCGGHTPHAADLVEAVPDLSLEEFQRALLAGRVEEKGPSLGREG